jgi:hypothetical protein
VSSYRHLRRQSRQIRRAGMQPMMFVNSDGQLPDIALMVICRWLWRYRSELAPVAAAIAALVIGWWAHKMFFAWWGLALIGSGVAAWTLWTFGGWIGITALSERLYVAACAMASGSWVTLAAAAGPFTSPAPQILSIAAFILAVPWWANRRRRAKVRVDRTLAAWPDIARAVGLSGSQVMSAVVDLWGWRARLRLSRGQTITDVAAKIPALESGLGTHRNAIRVYPTPDDLANRCELRVLDRDPHAEAITWPGPSIDSINQPIDLGPFEDAEPCRILFLRRHGMFAGTTGAGKSGGINVLMGNLTACHDVVIWAIDLKRGMELGPWASCIDRLATTPAEAAALLRDATAIVQARAAYLASAGLRTWEPTPDMPALVIVIDEYAELSEQAPDAMTDTDSITRLGRAVAVTLVAATQRPTQKVMGQGAVRSMMDLRICFRVRERRDVDLILGQGMLSAGWNAHKLNAPGKFLISAPEHDTPRRARAYHLTDQAAADAARRHAPIRPELDSVSRQATGYGDTAPPITSAPDTEDADPPEENHPEFILWTALSLAPDEGISVPDLVDITRMSRRWVYYRLRELASVGHVVQTTRGQWRITPEHGDHE